MSDKPDWKTSPHDAQFYSFGAFRKYEDGREYIWRGSSWDEVLFDRLEWHKNEFEDFEVRPEQPASTAIKPDWTKAPADAQFFSNGMFRKIKGGSEFCWAAIDWIETKFYPIECHTRVHDFEMRPESSEPEWDGQGLPPVGTVCEVEHGNKWVECEVVAHFMQKHGMVAAFTVCDDDGIKNLDYFADECFRPVKSDRDKWIDAADQLMKSMPYDQKIAPYLYDALKSGKLPTP